MSNVGDNTTAAAPAESVTLTKEQFEQLVAAQSSNSQGIDRLTTLMHDMAATRAPGLNAATIEAGPPARRAMAAPPPAVSAINVPAAAFNYRSFLAAAKPFARALDSTCGRFGYSQLQAFLQICQESGWNPDAKSGAGAIGLCQIMPDTARGWGVNPFDPDDAMRGLATNMRDYQRTFAAAIKAGTVRAVDMQDLAYSSFALALAAYDAGPEAVDQHQGIPPFDETQHYVALIGNTFRSIMLSEPARMRWIEDWNALLR
jgi:soluble lytic murein transglycosylase-like protein